MCWYRVISCRKRLQYFAYASGDAFSVKSCTSTLGPYFSVCFVTWRSPHKRSALTFTFSIDHEQATCEVHIHICHHFHAWFPSTPCCFLVYAVVLAKYQPEVFASRPPDLTGYSLLACPNSRRHILPALLAFKSQMYSVLSKRHKLQI